MARRVNQKIWWSTIITPGSVAAATKGQTLLSTAAALGSVRDDDYTILRIVGYLRAAAASGVTGSITGALGIIVLDYPISGIPPTMDAEQDGAAQWLWWQPVVMSMGSSEAGSGRSLLHWQLDIRSKRICERAQQLYLCYSNSGANAYSLYGGLRVLCLEP